MVSSAVCPLVLGHNITKHEVEAYLPRLTLFSSPFFWRGFPRRWGRVPIAGPSLPPDGDAPIDLSGGAPTAEAGVPPEVVRDPPPKGTLEEAQSQAHLMTHMPKNPFCDVCSKAKMQRRQKRRKKRPSLFPMVNNVRLLPSSGSKSRVITS